MDINTQIGEIKMDKKEYRNIAKDIQERLDDFGFVDPDNIISQLKSIFEVEDEDINVSGLISGITKYEVHFYDYIVELVVKNYEFKIDKILEYDDTI